MAEHTPTTKDVRAIYVYGTPPHRVTIQDGYAEFDRWLAAHDRAVRAEALREAADDWGDTTWNDVWMADGVEDDVSAVQSTVRWLRARADALGGDRGISQRTCGYVKADYLSPWDREQSNPPSTLTCDLPDTHYGYHRAAEDGGVFGPWRNDDHA